jgi:hypothetical protein
LNGGFQQKAAQQITASGTYIRENSPNITQCWYDWIKAMLDLARKINDSSAG